MKKMIKLVAVLLVVASTQSIIVQAMHNDPQLVEAVQEEDVQKVQDLLEAKVDPNSKNENGSTALGIAAQLDDPAITQLLLKYGADANQRDGGLFTPLFSAVTSTGNPEIIKLLIEHGASLTLSRRGYEFHALLMAYEDGLKDAIFAILTAIPSSKKKSIMQQKSRIIATELSLKKGEVASRDIRKLITKAMIDAFVDEYMQYVQGLLSTQYNGKTLYQRAFADKRNDIAALINFNDPDAYKKIRAEVRKNIVKIMFSKPTVPVNPQEQTAQEGQPSGFYNWIKSWLK